MCLWCLYQKLLNPVTSAVRIIDRYRSHPLTGFVEANLARSEYTRSAFLDIEGAFTSIKNSLRDRHILGNRLIRSNLGGCSIDKRAIRGTPQTGAIPSLVALGC